MYFYMYMYVCTCSGQLVDVATHHAGLFTIATCTAHKARINWSNE